MKGVPYAKACSYLVRSGRPRCGRSRRPGPTIGSLQDLRRATEGVHEELRRTGLQDRVPNVPEILQIEIEKGARDRRLADGRDRHRVSRRAFPLEG
jgi:hypothetical protein